MITKVYDEQGNLVHDCAEVGCSVSWDGYLIADGTPVQGRQDPPPATWTVQGAAAHQKPRPVTR